LTDCYGDENRSRSAYKKTKGHSDPSQSGHVSPVAGEVSLPARAPRQPSASKGECSIPSGIPLVIAQCFPLSLQIRFCQLQQLDWYHFPAAEQVFRREVPEHILEPGRQSGHSRAYKPTAKSLKG
jgi:hypothetical protein